MEHDLPDGIDPELWFACPHNPEARDYLAAAPGHTHPGRMAAWCGDRDLWFRVSLGELPDDAPLATRSWARGFVAGNLPDGPDPDEAGPAELETWSRRAEAYVASGVWLPEG